jgi:hypothetical protein
MTGYMGFIYRRSIRKTTSAGTALRSAALVARWPVMNKKEMDQDALR